MITVEDISSVRDVRGVNQYVLVDKTGCIISPPSEFSGKMTKVVIACMEATFPLVKNRFKYIKFFRSNQAHFYVFPVGKYGLGVIKEKTVSDSNFQNEMIRFLSGLVNREAS